MTSNPKIMIALAFVLTFLIGVSAGFLVRGEVMPPAVDQNMVDRDDRRQLWRQGSADRAERGEQSGRFNRRDRTDREAGLQRESRDGSGWRRGERDSDGYQQSERNRRNRSETEEYRQRNREAGGRGEQTYQRIRERLIRDLNLSDETAESFFNLLEEHRDKVKQDIVEQQRKIREQYQVLREQLENELSQVLSEEQLEIWQEKFAPRMDRRHQDRIDDQ